MIGLITVAWHDYLAQQIVQMFITIKNFCRRWDMMGEQTSRPYNSTGTH